MQSDSHNHTSKIAPKNILIVDDSDDMRKLLTMLFQSKGYSVDSSTNGAEAIATLNSNKHLPDVILLDLRMPVMDGLGFLELQKSSGRLRDIPVILMTAEEDLSLLKNKFVLQGILPKPLTMPSLLSAIDRSTFAINKNLLN